MEPFLAGGSRGEPDGHTLPGLVVDARFTGLLTLLYGSLAEATWAAYVQVWGSWTAVAQVEGWDTHGNRVTATWVLFSRALQDGRSGAWAARVLSALSCLCRLVGWQDIGQDPLLRQVVKGWRKARVPDCRRPVSEPLLLRVLDLLPLVCFTEFEALLFQVAFTFCFYGALRVGELVSRSAACWSGLQVEHVHVQEGRVVLWIPHSKTDQSGKGERVTLGATGGRGCPVALTLRYLQVRPQGKGPLLRHVSGLPLTRFQFAAVFRRCLAEAGMDPHEFAPHSFRIGAATVAAEAGASDAMLRRLGRWRSTRFRTYVRPHLL